MMAVRWDREIIVANVGRVILTKKMPGTMYCSPMLSVLAIGRPVSNGMGLGTMQWKMRRKASWRVSTGGHGEVKSVCASVELLLEADDAAVVGGGEDVGDVQE